MAAASQIADGVMNWINKKGFTVDAVNSAAQKLGYDINNLTRGQKGSITKLINEGVSNVSNATGRNNSKTSFNSIVRSIRKEGGAIQDIFNGMNPKSYASQDAYEQAVDSLWRNRNKISSLPESDPIMTKPVSKLTPEELKQRRINRGLDAKSNPPSQRQAEVEGAFGSNPSSEQSRQIEKINNMSDGRTEEILSDAKSSGKSLDEVVSDLEEAEQTKHQQSIYNEAKGKKDYINESTDRSDFQAPAVTQTSEIAAPHQMSESERRMHAAAERQAKIKAAREKYTKGATDLRNQRDAFDETIRAQKQDMGMFGKIGAFFKELGSGEGESTKWIRGRKTRGNYNMKLNDLAFDNFSEFMPEGFQNTASYNFVTGKLKSSIFDSIYQGSTNRYIKNGGAGAGIVGGMPTRKQMIENPELMGEMISGEYFKPKPKSASGLDGIADWMKDHQLVVAGAIAGATIGGAMLINNSRDGD